VVPRGALDASCRRVLERVLAEAQRRGFVGPGPIEIHIDRALDLAEAVDGPPDAALDLGSGGGVPGLPLALAWPSSKWALLDGSINRTDFLRHAVDELGLAARVDVIGQRAEDAGRGERRGRFDLVTARSFAGPAVTAECGSPFLRVGGRLVVAEPPGGRPERWDPAGVALFGLTLGPAVSSPTAYQVLLQGTACPERFPRRVGVPAKRPLFASGR
jgi:16S rRNA (guanine527-N7)-methyltransferase